MFVKTIRKITRIMTYLEEKRALQKIFQEHIIN